MYVATVKTGCDDIYPVAVAVTADNENTEGWRWFLENLKEACPILVTGPPKDEEENEEQVRTEEEQVEEEERLEQDDHGVKEDEGTEEDNEEGVVLTMSDYDALDKMEEENRRNEYEDESQTNEDGGEGTVRFEGFDYFRFISDREKGLKKALLEVFPRNHTSFCAVHIQRNAEGLGYGKDGGKDVVNLAKTFSMARAEEILINMPVKVRKYVEEIEPLQWRNTSWIRHPELPPRFGIISSNDAEATNSMFEEARHGPWLFSLDEMLGTMAERITKLRDECDHRRGIVPKVEAKLSVLWEESALYEVAMVERGCDIFRVTKIHTDTTTSDWWLREGKRFNVNVEKSECDCGKWQGLGYPCVHAVAYLKQYAGLTFKQMLRLGGVKAFYTFRNERELLSRCFHTICMDTLVRDLATRPPKVNEKKKKAGRKKKDARLRRRTAVSETEKSPIVCSQCGQRGHNRRTCLLRQQLLEEKKNKNNEKAGPATMSQELDLS